MKDEYFENTDFRELNMWATQYGAERSPRDQLLGFRVEEACEKFKVKNAMALWCYAATKSTWFANAPKDHYGQIRWCEALASEYNRLIDIRYMQDLSLTEIKTMEKVWDQATARLDEYAKFKKPKEPKLPVPGEVPKKKEEEKPKEPAEPFPKDKEDSKQDGSQNQKSMIRKAIGAIAGALAFVVDKIPVPAPIQYILKAIFATIAAIFK
jgi:hypothetical protein